MQISQRSLTVAGVLTVALYGLTNIGYWSNQELGFISRAYAQTKARPETSPKTPKVAVSMAKNAFEYRDFKKVIGILDPWVHPPRIADKAQMTEARRLLGISQHLLGNTDQAKEEFAQLILLAPEMELDPFVVPPAVIQTFEQVKKAVVGSQPAPNAATKIETKTIIKKVVSIHPSVSLVPFAYAQLFALEDQKAWGIAWFTTQAVGLLLNIGGYWAANQLRTPAGLPSSRQADFDRYVIGMYSGIALWSAGYLGSALQGYGAITRQDQMIRGDESVSSSVQSNRWGPTPSLQLTLPFP